MKRWAIVVMLLALAAAAAAFWLTRGDGGAPTFRFVAVERGDVDAVVSATGTLSAVTTVQVGTQVSGLISRLLVDFNDKVEKGQVIAQLDTTLLESSLRDAEAAAERHRAELAQAERDLARIQALFAQGIAADADLNKAQYTFDVARASVKSGEAALARARQNLAYATITAPVSGTVVERAVDVGQTVAASLSAPRLFTIANDLARMQILAPVDESDIGQIAEGQTARFTVKAYPERKFTGAVRQVRLQSTVEQNIVNYTVVIAVENPDGALLPGMTATVEFLVASAHDVLRVPNAALRFRPPEEIAAPIRERLQREREARRAAAESGGGGETAGPPAGSGHGGGPGAGGGISGRPGAQGPTLLYHLDERGELTAMPVRTGLTDGQFTEVRGRTLSEGLQVVTGMTQPAARKSANPFQQATPQGGRPPGPPGTF